MKVEKRELPKTGGIGAAPLFVLGVGALLVAGALVACRISGKERRPAVGRRPIQACPEGGGLG
jgi:LPXTG-motif cell wall-anchored protein